MRAAVEELRNEGGGFILSTGSGSAASPRPRAGTARFPCLEAWQRMCGLGGGWVDASRSVEEARECRPAGRFFGGLAVPANFFWVGPGPPPGQVPPDKHRVGWRLVALCRSVPPVAGCLPPTSLSWLLRRSGKGPRRRRGNPPSVGSPKSWLMVHALTSGSWVELGEIQSLFYVYRVFRTSQSNCRQDDAIATPSPTPSNGLIMALPGRPSHDVHGCHGPAANIKSECGQPRLQLLCAPCRGYCVAL